MEQKNMYWDNFGGMFMDFMLCFVFVVALGVVGFGVWLATKWVTFELLKWIGYAVVGLIGIVVVFLLMAFAGRGLRLVFGGKR